jgi:TetR/AcrR family transcriptional regulator
MQTIIDIRRNPSRIRLSLSVLMKTSSSYLINALVNYLAMTSSSKSNRSPGRPAASLHPEARDLLLTAATELFAEQGVAATTFANIAQRAGLTPAMLHYYFKDREQLLDAVVDERLTALIASVWSPAEPNIAPAALLSGVVDRMLAGIEQMPWVPSTWMREVLNEGGLLRSRVLRHLPFDKIQMVSKSIARGQAEHTINPDLDPSLVVFSMLGLVMMHMATIRFWAATFQRPVPSRQAIGRHITGLLLHGLNPARPRKQQRRKK